MVIRVNSIYATLGMEPRVFASQNAGIYHFNSRIADGLFSLENQIVLEHKFEELC